MTQKKKTDEKETQVRVLVEMRVPRGKSPSAMLSKGTQIKSAGFVLDTDYEPVPMNAEQYPEMKATTKTEDIVVVRGTVEKGKITDLEAHPNVVKVWTDAKIEPCFAQKRKSGNIATGGSRGICPIPPCDCTFTTATGDLASVAAYLGVDQIWAKGYKGAGIVVGIVDGGITAVGRPTDPDDINHINPDTGKKDWPGKLVPNVINGWPAADWGTTGWVWGWHGNMTSSDVLGMAPEAQIHDLRISDAATMSAFLSNVLQVFNWAIAQHKANGTPHILSNSWALFDKNDAPDFATDANHVVTKKIVEAINEGILVLFAAGNCGETCPDGRCGTWTGPGNSIWGSSGHPKVITVGAVTQSEKWIGYSSQGPAALDPNKPDFCSISQFKGYFACDNGTSAAAPIASGVVALLKQYKPNLTQDEVKTALKSTAKDIGGAGWDQHSGAGIIQAKKAFDSFDMTIHCVKGGPDVPDKICRRGGPYWQIHCAAGGPDQLFHIECPGPFFKFCKAGGPGIYVGCGGGADFQIFDLEKFRINPERWIVIKQDRIPKALEKSFFAMLEKMRRER